MQEAKVTQALMVPDQQALSKPQRTDRQIAASRRNGRRSRGPTSVEGKRKSSLNAVRHGIFSRTIPEYRYPLYYSAAEVTELAADVARQMGCRSTFSYSLAESIATDLLRIRHVRTLEHSLLNTDVERDRDVKQALQQKRGDLWQKTDGEHEALLAAALKAQQALSASTPFSLSRYELELLAPALWNRMTAARRTLDKARQDLAEIDEESKQSPESLELKGERKRAEEAVQEAEQAIANQNVAQYGIETEDDLHGILTTTKPVPADSLAAWTNLMADAVYAERAAIQQAEDRQRWIATLRRTHLRKSLDELEKLNQLTDYAGRIQRQMERTLAMLREVEGLSVVDL